MTLVQKKSQPESYTLRHKETKIHTKKQKINKQTKNNIIANKEDQVAGRSGHPLLGRKGRGKIA